MIDTYPFFVAFLILSLILFIYAELRLFIKGGKEELQAIHLLLGAIAAGIIALVYKL